MSSHSSTPQPAPSSNVDRFRQIPNPSKYFHNYPLYPLPRCCPPHRCSGRPPLDTYDLVERHIQSIASGGVASILLVSEDHDSRPTRLEILQVIAHQTTDFENVTISSKRMKEILTYRVELKSQFVARRDIRNMALSLSGVGDVLRASFGSAGRIKCMCDLTHACAALEEISKRLSAQTSIDIKNQLRPTLERVATPQQLLDLVDGLDSSFPPGSEYGRRWAQRTRSQRVIWVERMLAEVTPMIVDVYFPLTLVCWTDTLRIFGAARILEDFWIDDQDEMTLKNSLVALEYSLQGVNLYPSTMKEWKALATKCAVSQSNLVEAIGFYDYVTLLDPIDAQNRVNLAGARLRVANNSTQLSQWPRAIHDCTLALYYGPPTFKAYYRRGFALAHLKMWDKAILDYQNALRIEPHNALIKSLLRAVEAKAKVKR